MKKSLEIIPMGMLTLSSSSESELEEHETLPVVLEKPPPIWSAGVATKKRLSKQMSMKETTREAAWERRRRQIMRRRRSLMAVTAEAEEEEEEEDVSGGGGEGGRRRRVRSLTDEDLDELRGSIDLGFGFNEEDGGHNLCNTLPALDLYFAVNRQFSDPKMHYSPSPVSTPTTAGGGGSSSSLVSSPSPRSPRDQSAADSWKILHPGDSPQHVKTRLRHWAQAVACSVRQSQQQSS